MRYNEEEKTIRLEDWKQSGKRAWAYAKENGFNTQTFVKWTREEAEEKQSFVEVASTNRISTQVRIQIPEILIEKGEIKIHIPLVIGCGELRAVMEGLGAAL